jgi:hypothetical protein
VNITTKGVPDVACDAAVSTSIPVVCFQSPVAARTLGDDVDLVTQIVYLRPIHRAKKPTPPPIKEPVVEALPSVTATPRGVHASSTILFIAPPPTLT